MSDEGQDVWRGRLERLRPHMATEVIDLAWVGPWARVTWSGQWHDGQREVCSATAGPTTELSPAARDAAEADGWEMPTGHPPVWAARVPVDDPDDEQWKLPFGLAPLLAHMPDDQQRALTPAGPEDHREIGLPDGEVQVICDGPDLEIHSTSKSFVQDCAADWEMVYEAEPPGLEMFAHEPSRAGLLDKVARLLEVAAAHQQVDVPEPPTSPAAPSDGGAGPVLLPLSSGSFSRTADALQEAWELYHEEAYRLQPSDKVHRLQSMQYCAGQLATALRISPPGFQPPSQRALREMSPWALVRLRPAVHRLVEVLRQPDDVDDPELLDTTLEFAVAVYDLRRHDGALQGEHDDHGDLWRVDEAMEELAGLLGPRRSAILEEAQEGLRTPEGREFDLDRLQQVSPRTDLWPLPHLTALSPVNGDDWGKVLWQVTGPRLPDDHMVRTGRRMLCNLHTARRVLPDVLSEDLADLPDGTYWLPPAPRQRRWA